MANAAESQVGSEIECWSYTHARRHPSVLGKVGGANLPFGPYSPAQVVTFMVLFALLLMTKGTWGHVIHGGVMRTGVLIFVPGGAMWFVRNVKVEGRSPFRFLIGFIQSWIAPRHGLCRGKRMKRRRIHRLKGHSYSTYLETQHAPPKNDIRTILSRMGSTAR